jgi:hypothetical protein
MKVTQKLLISGLLLTSVQMAFAARDDDLNEFRQSGIAADEWQLIRNDKRHSIMQYVKRDLGKTLRSFKIEYEVDGTLDTISRVSFDFPNYKRWYYQIKEAKVLKKVSDREFYYYQIHQAPATLPDRDVVLHATIQPYSVKTGYAMMTLESIPDFIPLKPPLVRMVAENMTVKWIKIGKNRWKNISEGYIDPNGGAPDWAINFVQRQAPYQTVLGIQRMIESPTYAESKEVPLFSYGDAYEN